ncbi:hypothetical protein LTS18_006611 [Coniosporium uncinatum]|uniref:Uncharacterized protein n=1 Tax=Coniosporium uncinatum TaxID=93489 RepID=A0ACC3DXP9_9PEZI|nr:hypothetical protein LTS18_006611 [Coniosporium uncinatum]
MDEDEDSPDGDDDDDDADEEEDEDEDDDDHDDDDDDSDNGDESEPLVSHVGTLSTIDSATATPQQIQDQLQNVMSIMQQAHAQMISRATVSVPTWSSASNKRTLLESVAHQAPPPPIPSCPILQLSVRDIFLLQPVNMRRGHHLLGDAPPVVHTNDPFRQRIIAAGVLHPSFNPAYTRIWDRMCFLESIPELGIVIVGSPIGRVLILSLARITLDKDPIYCFRMDAILPFKSQEDTGMRPAALMSGIAASPLQGVAENGANARWRLMMYYADHSILSYELAKASQKSDVTSNYVV